jgi:hypothetical protein
VLFYYALGAATKGVRVALDEVKRTMDVRMVANLIEDQVDFESAMGYSEYENRVARFGGTYIA